MEEIIKINITILIVVASILLMMASFIGYISLLFVVGGYFTEKFGVFGLVLTFIFGLISANIIGFLINIIS